MMLLSLMLLSMTSTGEAAGRAGQGFGIGAVIGEPSGLTMAWKDSQGGVQTHLSWSLKHDHFRVSADYLYNVAEIPTSGPTLPFYVGIGGVVGIGDDTSLGVRVPLGLALIPRQAPVEGFVELAPTVYLFPDTDVDIEGVLGARFYF